MTYSQWFIAQNLLCETPYFMGEPAWKHQQDIINRLQMALADTEALEVGTAEKVKHLQAQLESEQTSHAAWEKQSLLEYSEVVQERDALRDVLDTLLQRNSEIPLDTHCDDDYDWVLSECQYDLICSALAKLKEE